jgi:hypothetical protein
MRNPIQVHPDNEVTVVGVPIVILDVNGKVVGTVITDI